MKMHPLTKRLLLLTAALAGHVTFAVADETNGASAPTSPVSGSAPVCTLAASDTNPSVGATIVLTATCTATSLTSGPATYSVVAANLAGASAPATVSVNWGSGTTIGTDWAQRSAGRLFARRLASADTSDANLAGRHPSAEVGVWTPDTPTKDTYEEPVIDALGLRFDVKQGRNIPDWYFKLPRAFGANSSFRLQWQQRFNQAFISTVFRTSGGSYPGIKLAIISAFEASSPWEKLVVSTMDQHKFPFLYRYDQMGNTDNLEPGVGVGPTDFDWQPKQGQEATCLYTRSNTIPQGQNVPGCMTLVADKWITFDLEADTGDVIPGTNTWDCEIRLYMTVDGVRQLVIDYGKNTRGYTGRNAKAWTGVWLAPYMTDRDPKQAFAVIPSTWYREVIVDDKAIAGNPAPATAPSTTAMPTSMLSTPTSTGPAADTPGIAIAR